MSVVLGMIPRDTDSPGFSQLLLQLLQGSCSLYFPINWFSPQNQRSGCALWHRQHTGTKALLPGLCQAGMP